MSLFIPLASQATKNKKSVQGVIDLVLVNAETKAEITSIAEGQIIDLAQLSTNKLNILAQTSPDTIGSVKFVLSGAESRTFIENTGPYLLFGDANNVYNNWTPAVGKYTLKAIPYTLANATGLEGYALTLNFEIRNIIVDPNAPQLADINALLNYTRNGITEVNVIEPLFGDTFIYLSTWPYTFDNVNTYPAKGGGFWQRKNITEIDLRHCGALVNNEGDSLTAWKTAIKMAQRYKVPINHDGYNTMIYPTASGVPLTVPDNITIDGPTGVISAKIKNPLDYTEGYQMINWSGKNGVFYGIFNGGKNNSQLNNTPSSPPSLVKWSGDFSKCYGYSINSNGYGIELNGEGAYYHNVNRNTNYGYAAILFKARKAINNWNIGVLKTGKETYGPKASNRSFSIAAAETTSYPGGAYPVKNIAIDEIDNENGFTQIEAIVTGLNETGSNYPIFENIHVKKWKSTLNHIYTYANGAAVSGNIGKAENVGTLTVDDMTILAGVDGLQGWWNTQTEKFYCPSYYTNTFMMVPAITETVIGTFEFNRRSALTPADWYMMKRTGKKLIIDNFIINNNNFNLVNVPSFELINIKDNFTGIVQINNFQIIGGTGFRGLKLHNGTKSQTLKQFILPSNIPPEIILPQ